MNMKVSRSLQHQGFVTQAQTSLLSGWMWYCKHLYRRLVSLLVVKKKANWPFVTLPDREQEFKVRR